MRRKKARIVVDINDDFVTIDVSEKILQWSLYYPHEEGSHLEEHSWYIDDGMIYWHIHTHDRDCDGPLSRDTVLRCRIRDAKNKISGFPEWTRVQSWQRDYYAEAMGY